MTPALPPVAGSFGTGVAGIDVSGSGWATATATATAAGRAMASLIQYETALALRPDHAGALTGLGTLLARRGDLAGAAARLEQAVRVAPYQVEPRKNLGIVRMLQGRLAEAATESLREKVAELRHLVHFVHMGPDLGFGELANGVPEHGLFLGQYSQSGGGTSDVGHLVGSLGEVAPEGTYSS